MQGYSFETFQVSNANRVAFEWCQSAAAAPDKTSGPVLLLGPEGTGKSHLLWSVVKAIRSSDIPTGLALVMPGAFPDKVRQLAENPAPIQNGRSAILLVDALENFREELPDLERVMEAFLAHRQAVVISSNVHPQRLNRLSSRLRAVLSGGRIIELQREAPADAGDADNYIARINRLEEERAQLKAELATHGDARAQVKRLKEAAQAAQAENMTLKASLEAAVRYKNEAADLSATCAALQARIQDLETQATAAPAHPIESVQLEQLIDRLEALQAENESQKTALEAAAQAEENTSQLGAEAESLRARITELEAVAAVPAPVQDDSAIRAALAEAQGEADEALAKQALLQGKLAAAKHRAEELEKAGAERDKLKAELDRFRENTEAAVAVIESKTTERAALERKVIKALESFTVRLFAHEHPKVNEEEWRRLEAELGDARSLGQAFRKQLAAERARFAVKLSGTEKEVEHMQSLLEEARGEQGRISVAYDAMRGRAQATEFELEKARKQLALQHAEMDALRHEAASQVASANLQAGAMEHRLSGLEDAFTAIREAGKDTGLDVRHYSGELSNMASTLDLLASRLARLQELTVDHPASGGSLDDQGVLFDPDTMRIRAKLAEEADEEPGDSVSMPKRDDQHFRSVVKNALSLDEKKEQESA